MRLVAELETGEKRRREPPFSLLPRLLLLSAFLKGGT